MPVGQPPAPGRPVPALTRAQARRQLLQFFRRLVVLVILIVVLVAAGTAAFTLTEGVSVWYGFQWSLDTIATVGSIPNPNDVGAQIVKVVLIVFGVGTLFYALVTTTEFFVAGYMSGLLYERRTQRMIEELKDHHLICGFGRVGRQVARDLRDAGDPLVVIDPLPENREFCARQAIPYVEGPPSEDEVLQRAGIDRARSVIACMDSDAENIFVTLTARGLRDDVTIVARAAADDSERKLRRAGANRVISPYKASGAVMARLALNPDISVESMFAQAATSS